MLKTALVLSSSFLCCSTYARAIGELLFPGKENKSNVCFGRIPSRLKIRAASKITATPAPLSFAPALDPNRRNAPSLALFRAYLRLEDRQPHLLDARTSETVLHINSSSHRAFCKQPPQQRRVFTGDRKNW